MPTSRPSPSWSVFDRRSRTRRPSTLSSEVLDVQGDELAATEAAGEAEEQQRAVAQLERVAAPQAGRLEEQAEVRGQDGRRLALRSRAGAAADAGERRAHDGVLGRARVPGRLVRLADRREPALERRWVQAALVAEVGEVAADRRRRGRHGVDAVTAAPGGEVRPVAPVRAQRGGGLGVSLVGAHPIVQRLDVEESDLRPWRAARGCQHHPDTSTIKQGRYLPYRSCVAAASRIATASRAGRAWWRSPLKRSTTSLLFVDTPAAVTCLGGSS
jgi:hypothetical protein